MNVSFLYLQLEIFGIISADNAMLLKLINECKFSILAIRNIRDNEC